MNNIRKLLMMTSFLIALPLAGCNAETDLSDKELKKLVQEVAFDLDSVTLEVGETVQLNSTVTFKDGAEHEIAQKWITSDINVCSVDDGMITAIGSGEANVSLIVGYKMATCSVLVPSSGGTSFTITLSDSNVEMEVGETYQLVATLSSETALSWASSDNDVVTVSETGEVTAVNIGDADVGVSALGVSTSCHFSVVENVNAFIKLDASKVNVAPGDTYELHATTKEPATVTWECSDTTLATVSSSGVVTVKEDAEGSFTIKATANGETANCVFEIISEEDTYDVTIYFFIDYNNIDAADTTGTKRLAKFRWYTDQPISKSGKVPANPSQPMDPAFPYFIGWSSHTIIDSKDDLWKMDSDTTGPSSYFYLYGIWADVTAGEFTK